MQFPKYFAQGLQAQAARQGRGTELGCCHAMLPSRNATLHNAADLARAGTEHVQTKAAVVFQGAGIEQPPANAAKSEQQNVTGTPSI